MIEPIELRDSVTGPLIVRTWDTAEFRCSRRAWQELLAASDADPLFMSWDWQWRWWQHHAPALDATLRLLAVYSGSRLVGLAPLYSHSVVTRRFLRRRRMEFIGTAWRNSRATFSDYLDIVVTRELRDAVGKCIVAWLERQSFWDELVFCCTRRDGFASTLVQHGLSRFAYVREVDPLAGWCAYLPPRFEHYLERLSSDVRRRLFHQRRKLVDAELQYASEAEVGEFLQELRRYSVERWHEASTAAPNADFESSQFLADFALCTVRTGGLRLSRLRASGTTISVMYNVRVGDALYFLQSGFDAAATRGLSPGYLHFGYAIEAACKERVGRFDFLAGPGLHRDYKRDLAAEPVAVVTYHVIRGGLAARLYGAYERWRRCQRSLRLVWRIAPMYPSHREVSTLPRTFAPVPRSVRI